MLSLLPWPKFFLLFSVARSPASVAVNDRALNSVVRGEKMDGLDGVSCNMRSILAGAYEVGRAVEVP